MEELQVEYQIVGHAPDPRLIANFTWTETDPAALRVEFQDGTADPVEWIFSRELCHDGLSSISVVGKGDVRFGPFSGSHFKIYLSSPDGDAEILMETNLVSEFIQRTERVMPTAVFDGSPEAAKISAELDFAIEAILSGSDGQA